MLTPDQITKTLREKGHKYQKCIGTPFKGEAVCLIGLLCREYLSADQLMYLRQLTGSVNLTTDCINALERAGFGVQYVVRLKYWSDGEARKSSTTIWLDRYLWGISDSVSARTWDEMADIIDKLEVLDEPVS